MFIPPLNGAFLKAAWNKVGFYFFTGLAFLFLIIGFQGQGDIGKALETTKSWFCICLMLAFYFSFQNKTKQQLNLSILASLFGLFLYVLVVPNSAIIADLSEPKIEVETREILKKITVDFYFTIITLIMFYTIVFSAIYGRFISLIFDLKSYLDASDWNVRLIRLHPYYIWLFLISSGVGFSFDLGFLSLVLKNIAAFLAFGPMLVQGFYVFDHVLRSMKISRFFRHLIHLFVVLQMFFVLIALGFADFWLDLRRNSIKSLFTKGKKI